jgi:6-phosphogluconolactonase
MSPNSNLEIAADEVALAHRAAQLFLDHSLAAVQASGTYSVALSGGSTPRRLYQLLANPDEPYRAQCPWSHMHFFWSDERHVPPDHKDSNFRMADAAMLSRVPVPVENIHRIPGENPHAGDAAKQYEATLRNVFHLSADERPRFDLILLGLGTDGHTASIFPGSDVVDETQRLVAAPWVEKLENYRITLTMPVLNSAACVVFLVSGAEKAAIVRAILNPDRDASRLPAREVAPLDGTLLWLLDQSAANLIPG